MKKFLGLNFLSILVFFCFSFADKDVDFISETLGHFIKQEIDKAQYQINIDKVIEGLLKANEGKPSPLSKKEYDLLVSKIVNQKNAKIEKENLQIANDFFLNNKKDKSIIEIIDKKLQYQVISEGTGETVGPYHSPVINIKAFLPDNTLFFSEQELVTPLNDLPEGLKLAIVGMKEKEKRKIYIHPDFKNKIFESPFPRSLLIYEIEILKNDKAKIHALDTNIANQSKTIR